MTIEREREIENLNWKFDIFVIDSVVWFISLKVFICTEKSRFRFGCSSCDGAHKFRPRRFSAHSLALFWLCAKWCVVWTLVVRIPGDLGLDIGYAIYILFCIYFNSHRTWRWWWNGAGCCCGCCYCCCWKCRRRCVWQHLCF